MTCTHNRNGKPHVTQENRKVRRQRRATQRSAEFAALSKSERESKAEKHRLEYVKNHSA